jgi:hypothetical protein
MWTGFLSGRKLEKENKRRNPLIDNKLSLST